VARELTGLGPMIIARFAVVPVNGGGPVPLAWMRSTEPRFDPLYGRSRPNSRRRSRCRTTCRHRAWSWGSRAAAASAQVVPREGANS